MVENKESEQADAEHRLNAVLNILYEANLRCLKNKIDKMKKEREGKCVVSSTVESQTHS